MGLLEDTLYGAAKQIGNDLLPVQPKGYFNNPQSQRGGLGDWLASIVYNPRQTPAAQYQSPIPQGSMLQPPYQSPLPQGNNPYQPSPNISQQHQTASTKQKPQVLSAQTNQPQWH